MESLKGEIWIALRLNVVGLADWRSLENEIFKEFNVFFPFSLLLKCYIGIIFELDLMEGWFTWVL